MNFNFTFVLTPEDSESVEKIIYFYQTNSNRLCPHTYQPAVQLIKYFQNILYVIKDLGKTVTVDQEVAVVFKNISTLEKVV